MKKWLVYFAACIILTLSLRAFLMARRPPLEKLKLEASQAIGVTLDGIAGCHECALSSLDSERGIRERWLVAFSSGSQNTPTYKQVYEWQGGAWSKAEDQNCVPVALEIAFEAWMWRLLVCTLVVAGLLLLVAGRVPRPSS